MNFNYLTLTLVTVIILPCYVLSYTPICPNITLMEHCVKDAEYDWEIDRNKKDSDSKGWCCHQWQAYECQMDLGEKCKAGTWDKTVFNSSMNALKGNLVKECTSWPEDKCTGLRWWAITLIVIGSLLLVALVGFLVFVLFVRRRSSRRYSAPKG